MAIFKVPVIPATTSKTIRFPNNLIDAIEETIRGKECTFTAFVVAATWTAIEQTKESQRIEQGTLVGSLETFCKLCEVLNVSPNYLLKDDIEIAEVKAALDLSDKFIHLNSEQLTLISTILDKINKTLENTEPID